LTGITEASLVEIHDNNEKLKWH